jgi:AAA+ superfamily predicted ATPase
MLICVSVPSFHLFPFSAHLHTLHTPAQANAPCLVFIDEIDSIAQSRESAQRQMESRIVAQLLTCMDNLNTQVCEWAWVCECVFATVWGEGYDRVCLQGVWRG